MARIRRTVVAWAMLHALCGPAARGDRVELADGRIVEGRFAMLPGVAIDPLDDKADDAAGGNPIVMCDDELTRTMVSRRKVAKAETAAVDLGMERILIPQRVPENGRRVAGIGGILGTTPFDAYGRRILSLATGAGRVDVVQGITEITPRWTRIQGVQTEHPLLLDMRLATTAIPRDALEQVINQHLDRTNPEERLRLVRLFVQAERYDEARAELDGVLADFPDLADLAKERKNLARLAASRILDEIQRRSRVGQDRLAIRLLEAFPADDADGELLEAVREERDRYATRRQRAAALVATARSRLAELDDAEVAAAAGGMIDEMERELSFATLDRLATFDTVGTDSTLPADRAVAIAIDGWLRGPEAGDDNLKTALSTARLRDQLRDYLRTTDATLRAEVLDRMRGEEAFGAATIAALAAHMRPPLDPPEPTAPGLHELVLPAIDGGEVRCLVQLPPEYDPLRRYPAVVTLHAAFSTPLQQIEWWAGVPNADGVRQGQAARHGTIVIAPSWARPDQTAYEYSAREHAAVLDAFRETVKRFSIDTDRVVLSGHSMGGDAAWDIALAHPDLWAGLVAITPAAGRYVNHYWPNAKQLPIYVVGGELDLATIKRNAMDLDRYFLKGYDATYVEYRGRGHEHFSDEIIRLFDWMGRKRRDFFPDTIDTVTMRPWDRFFWWIELEGAAARTVVLPANWPPPTGTRPFAVEGKVGAGNAVSVHCGAERVRIWLSPEMVDFDRPVPVSLDGQRLHRGPITPDPEVMLEDLRTRGDRQHPFWAVFESRRGPRR